MERYTTITGTATTTHYTEDGIRIDCIAILDAVDDGMGIQDFIHVKRAYRLRPHNGAESWETVALLSKTTVPIAQVIYIARRQSEACGNCPIVVSEDLNIGDVLLESLLTCPLEELAPLWDHEG